MKKITFKHLAVILVFALLFGTCLASCGKTDKDTTITIWAYDA